MRLRKPRRRAYDKGAAAVASDRAAVVADDRRSPFQHQPRRAVGAGVRCIVGRAVGRPVAARVLVASSARCLRLDGSRVGRPRAAFI